MKRRNYTAELRKAAVHGGVEIVCSLAPYEGQPVAYDPRKKGDPAPWRMINYPKAYRLNGRECHAVPLDGE